MPERIQMTRHAPWRAQHPDAVIVARRGPTTDGRDTNPFANPFPISRHGREESLRLYRAHLAAHPDLVQRARRELAGKDLACWCPPQEACHADILLDLYSTGSITYEDALEAHHLNELTGRYDALDPDPQ